MEIDITSSSSSDSVSGDTLPPTLEFRKAFYKLKFDKQWNQEVQRYEQQHNTLMGVIVEYTKATSPTSASTVGKLTQNPLSLSNNPLEYSYEVSLPVIKDLSDELQQMLSQNYKMQYG